MKVLGILKLEKSTTEITGKEYFINGDEVYFLYDKEEVIDWMNKGGEPYHLNLYHGNKLIASSSGIGLEISLKLKAAWIKHRFKKIAIHLNVELDEDNYLELSPIMKKGYVLTSVYNEEVINKEECLKILKAFNQLHIDCMDDESTCISKEVVDCFYKDVGLIG